MAKDRANNPKRKFDTSALSKMGNALGYLRGNSGMDRNPERNRADYTSKVDSGWNAANKTFYPGSGHVQTTDEEGYQGTAGIQNRNPRKED